LVHRLLGQRELRVLHRTQLFEEDLLRRLPRMSLPVTFHTSYTRGIASGVQRKN